MPSRLPDAASDIKVWGLVLNDALRSIQGSGRIIVDYNGNNPPTVKQGSIFFVYAEDTYLTPSTPETGNNVYPVDTNITYPVSGIVFEGADRTFSFGDTNFPASIGASKTYYLWCSGTEDADENDQGLGTYGMDETAPTYDPERLGWYNASNYRVIARVKTTAGSAIDTTSLYAYNNEDTSPWMYDINVFNGAWANTNWSTITLNTAYAMNGIKESTGAQNAEIIWPVTLSAGTWTFELLHSKNTDVGIYTVYLDDTSIGTIDGYAADTKNQVGTITSVSVTATGRYMLKIKMATKNGSSSNYFGRIHHVRLMRTT